MGMHCLLALFLAFFFVGVTLFSWDSFLLPLLSLAHSPSLLVRLSQAPDHTLSPPYHSHATQTTCNHFTCFNVYRCRTHHQQLRVHVSRPEIFIDPQGQEVAPWTQEFIQILEAIEASPYYTPEAHEACVFVPAMDFLNENDVQVAASGAALAMGSDWDEGRNNLVFTMLPGSPPQFSPSLGVPHGRAMVAGAGLNTWSYRKGFDIALPTFSPEVQGSNRTWPAQERIWRLVSSQVNIASKTQEILHELEEDHSQDLVVLSRCFNGGKNLKTRCRSDGSQHAYPGVMGQAEFCLVVKGVRLTQSTLMDAMHLGCIPVVVVDSLVLPFSEVLDWKRFSIRLFERNLPNVMEILNAISRQKVLELQAQVQWVYARYFESITQISLTTLDILNDRLFSHKKRTYLEWNVPIHYSNPLFLTNTPPESDGFTGVILTYDRLDSLFAVMNRIADTPSLTKIVVVWNNQEVAPPPAHEWPKLAKPFEVIRTSSNVLSNRFFPYDEITTECILSIDDDIIMLTADELEFGYQVWREFPDRIVGFPSRTHIWNNATSRWKYESEWTSQISMVLTGAAFYHKYWNYLYTASPSPETKVIKAWVDQNMNCEDIAMNFLVANVTGKSPIKVTPRKKFKCSTPKCTNVDMLSGIQSHMIERSDCINMFSQLYGRMPLKTVEFRADPVLFKEKMPDKLKEFNDIGSL
ncbi:hypothetical protein TCAL_09607 [Tigriopus californicus]|uniref:Exostosin-2 n=1 Tax=Tigriopus californicus TaxID=6832 RepID=A0A553P2U3_TIGCA|nr:exostosin-2-like [Tigriopus californicus]TRY72016.1 hypothetical protein TCAL_09607 [Tigriopus californicus]|eukprot:TCALIF_09607-PA protein Name:"Similar to Ext2 Exostosin-2 (Mus musculus)" AED:0.01 eAED:0.01 QI:0/-1/0/1/-1/1/1/0/692